ncbi:autotransporter adhesin [Bradyrhizobium sp. USDA 4501]
MTRYGISAGLLTSIALVVLAGSSMAQTAPTGIGGLAACNGVGTGYGLIGTLGVVGPVNCTNNISFEAYNDSGLRNDGSNSTAGIFGYTDGTLQLNGSSIRLLGPVNLNGNTITGLAPGSISATSTDAVNGGQLYGVQLRTDSLGQSAAATLGGMTTYNASTHQIGGFSALINGGTYTTVTDAVNAVETQINRLAASLPVQYSSASAPTTPNGSSGAGGGGATGASGASQDATMVGATAGLPVALHNVAAGELSTTSTDAVNGSQLYATSQSISNLTNSIQSGTIGPVQQAGGASSPITVGAQTRGTLVDVSGLDGNRVVTGVAAGAVNATSVDVVNGSQLYETNESISNLTNSIQSGTIGLMQQAGGASSPITVGAQTRGTLVDVSGMDGNRVVTGVAAGAVNATSVDAVNGSQLFAASNSVANALGGGASANIDGTVSGPTYVVQGRTYRSVGDALENGVQYDAINGVKQNSITLLGGSAGPVSIHNVAAGTAATDAVNVRQFNDGLASMSQSDRAYTDQRVGQANALARDAGATGAALAGLNRVDLRPRQSAVSMAVGGFAGATAIAAGFDYRITPSVQVHAGGSFAPNTNSASWNAGASYIFD